MTDGKQLCLTLDLENDWYFEEPGYDHLTLEHLDRFIRLIQRIDVPLSVFVVGKTLERYPEAIDRLTDELDCEFHLHSYRHETDGSHDFRTELRLGKEVFINHFGRKPVGYRAPYGDIDPSHFRVLAEEGFVFDSSIFPSYRPGVYNNLTAPTEPYVPAGHSAPLEIPIGVFRGLRIPLSQNYLKLFGTPLLRLLSVTPLPNTLVYNVHLQDLYRTDSHDKLSGVKKHIIKRNLSNSETVLEESIARLRSRGYVPTTMTAIAARNGRGPTAHGNDLRN